ncbi:protein kinase domain-containing protein [Lentibacillus saliphilus]|uniref:protein kinase domain-containing protein n=1 Tax=Lentibacillus saliphilus TaxID=2737028 RepID=UPI001C2F5463|nr:serine/threonine-protein kinase [Lentibacillus saliphilus]
MKQTSTKQGSKLQPGAVITGKWHQHVYKIERQLGSGAIGFVYLTRRNGEPAALKISEKGTSLTLEVNVLQSLAKVQGNRLGPYLLDVDDWIAPDGRCYTFYVMEYVQGQAVQSFIERRGFEWVGVFLLQLLDDLDQLHEQGWVFGDLKTANLIVTAAPIRIRWVDVGGTTQIGRAIKEYTEFFDRGYWQMGSRKAEPGYDLFALAMVIINMAYPNRFEKGAQPKVTLIKNIQKASPLKTYETCLIKAVKGQYKTSREMKKDVVNAIDRQQKNKAPSSKQRQPNESRHLLVESGSIAMIALLYYLTSLILP